MNGVRIQLSASVNARSTCRRGPATMPARSARIVLPSSTSSESVPVAREKTALAREVVTVTKVGGSRSCATATGETPVVPVSRRDGGSPYWSWSQAIS